VLAFSLRRLTATQAWDRNANGIDGLLAELDDKCLEVSLHAAEKAQVLAKFKPQQRQQGRPRKSKPQGQGASPDQWKTAEAKPDKPKPRPHPKAEVEHETHG
jgi:hypothetical protein